MEESTQSAFERRVAKYLQDAGYPSASLVHEPTLLPTAGAVRYRPDLGVLDPERGEYLALFEIKGNEDSQNIRLAASQLQKYSQALGKPELPRFIVTPGATASGLHLYAVDHEGRHQKVSLGELPSYLALRSSVSAAAKADTSGKLRRSTDAFRIVAWVAGFLAFGLAAADFYFKEFRGVNVLSAERLTLVGAALALLVLPFAAKLKVFGLEYESARREKEERERLS